MKKAYSVKQGPKKRIAYFGREGSFTHQAAESRFLDENLISKDSFSEVFDAVYDEEVNYGVLPVENSTEGIIAITYHLLLEQPPAAEVKICGEIYNRIHLNLLAKNEINIDDIRVVYTREVARRQCENWIRRNMKLSRVQFVDVASTEYGARMVAKTSKTNVAAIASELAARHYELNVLNRYIEDFKNNQTRFFIVGKKSLLGRFKNYKTTFGLVLVDKVGTLASSLDVLADNAIDLRSIKVTPVRDPQFWTWKDWFIIDMEGRFQDKKVVSALKVLEQQKGTVLNIKVLGSYGNAEPKESILDRYLRTVGGTEEYAPGQIALRGEHLDTEKILRKFSKTDQQIIKGRTAEFMKRAENILSIRPDRELQERLKVMEELHRSSLVTCSISHFSALLGVGSPLLDSRLRKLLFDKCLPVFGSIEKLKSELGISAKGRRFTGESVAKGLDGWNKKFPQKRIVKDDVIDKIRNYYRLRNYVMHGEIEKKLDSQAIGNCLDLFFDIMEEIISTSST